MRGGIVGEVCTCGERFDAFRAVDDEGHPLTYDSASAMLRVGSDDPALWRPRSRGAVLRFWGDLKQAQWEVRHGYCESIAAEDPEDRGADEGDTSFDVEAFSNATVTCEEHAPVEIEIPRCDCDHCTVARVVGAPLPVHRWQREHVERARCAVGISPSAYRGCDHPRRDRRQPRQGQRT